MTAAAGPTPDVVYRWDLDKTYLQTEFSTVRGLLQAAIEGPHRKRAIPGMRALLKALSEATDARVVVVSGSPTWLRRRILRMFALHTIRCDRLVLKDFGAQVRRGRLRAIRNQVGYKLGAHLETRLWLTARGEAAPEVCFGDDAEVDALVYCLYADVCARRVSAPRLARVLEVCGCYPDEIATILGRVVQLERHDPVRRVFIHLEGNSPPARFGAYRGRVVATFNALQIALDLATQGLCDDRALVAVAEELAVLGDFGPEALAGSMEDAVRRGLCGPALACRVAAELFPHTAMYDAGWSEAFGSRVALRLERSATAAVNPPGTEVLPYEQLFASEHAFARARRLARAAAGRIPGLAEFLAPVDDPWS
ncbi:MAG: hypothetical protein EXR79_09870 [Myxococcales bacterium]|nr:hypothetical protein [Myxococcales bacterium]